MTLCSDCSAKLKPVVAVDIDGTLGDYHGHLHEFAAGYLGRGRDLGVPYDGSEPHRDWFCRAFKVDVRTFRDIKLAYRQGAQKRTMPVFPGAAELCNAIRVTGAELWLTTTRPYLRLDNVDPDTRAWLARQQIFFDHMVYDDKKYPVLAGLVAPERVVAVLDDLPEQYAAAAAVFGPEVPILRRMMYNRAVKVDFEITNLWDAAKIIVQRINEWEAR